LSNAKILIADDDEAILRLLTVITRRAGFEPDTARDGIEAIRKIDEHNYAVVFLDLMMPGLNGYEVIEHLRQKGAHPAVIVATAINASRTLDPSVVHIVLRKPFDIDIVGALIAEAAGAMERPRATMGSGPTPLEAPVH
jgi:two-component system alkaline phosphatase synthesis response regulator PhoP